MNRPCHPLNVCQDAELGLLQLRPKRGTFQHGLGMQGDGLPLGSQLYPQPYLQLPCTYPTFGLVTYHPG
jgi:hypothetical protein